MFAGFFYFSGVFRNFQEGGGGLQKIMKNIVILKIWVLCPSFQVKFFFGIAYIDPMTVSGAMSVHKGTLMVRIIHDPRHPVSKIHSMVRRLIV